MYESRIERIEEDRSNRKQVKSIKTTVEATFEDGTKDTQIYDSEHLIAFFDQEDKDFDGMKIAALIICSPAAIPSFKNTSKEVFKRIGKSLPQKSDMLREMMKECGDEPDFMDILKSLLKDQDEKVPEKAEGSE